MQSAICQVVAYLLLLFVVTDCCEISIHMPLSEEQTTDKITDTLPQNEGERGQCSGHSPPLNPP